MRNTNAPGALARVPRRAVLTDPTITRSLTPPRKARRRAVQGEDTSRAALEAATLGTFDPGASSLLDRAIAEQEEQVSAFLREPGARGANWRDVFERWAEAQGMGEGARRALRVEILRARIFHAAERGTEHAERSS